MRGRAAVYVHPVALGALALLLLNDHLLKARWPGAVTGKVSDVAGPVVVAALLGSLARSLSSWRRAEAIAWWAVAAAFVVLKVWAPAASVAAPLLGGGGVVRDPYDLLGLLALPLAWRMTRTGAGRLRDSRVLRTAAAVLAVGAVTATTKATEYSVVELRTTETKVRAVLSDPGYGPGYATVAESTDGLTWDLAPKAPGSGSPSFVRPSEQETRGGLAACAGGHCYRVVAPGRVDESRDGGRTWHRSWRAANGGGRGDHGATAVVFVPGTDTAVVAVGRYGVLRREGTGPWQEVSVLSAHAERASQPDVPLLLWPFWLLFKVLVPLGAVLMALLVLVSAVVLLVRVLERRPAAVAEPNPWAPAAPPYAPPYAPPPGPPPPLPRTGRGRYRR
jgi:hypothetical protein